jgi:2-oxoglutarate dehydrogenase E1 component
MHDNLIHNNNLEFLESLYREYLREPSSVPAEWHGPLEGLFGQALDRPVQVHDGSESRRAGSAATAVLDVPAVEAEERAAISAPSTTSAPSSPASSSSSVSQDAAQARTSSTYETAPGTGRSDRAKPRAGLSGSGKPGTSRSSPAAESVPGLSRARVAELQDKVDQLIRAFRTRGHKCAAVNPLRDPPAPRDDLRLEYFGFTDDELDLRFSSDTIPGKERQSLREIVARLQSTYCRSIGVEYMHIDDPEPRWWLRDEMEASGNRIQLDRDHQIRILTCLTDAVIFEEFLHKKFQGAKSFSLEGAESLIPLLDVAIDGASAQGIDEIVLAMPHRGRLNVLANILGKSPQQIFSEFQDGAPELNIGGGDVKYHLGYSTDRRTSSDRTVHLTLCFNPSHLEFVNPVALGRMRAKQDRVGDAEGKRGLAILLHGDASFIGQGVTQETLNMSELPGYSVGGAIHVIVNNQIGFTTSPEEGRSSEYATSVARCLQIPIFHVNGEDPEAVAQVVHLALGFRKRFRRDVVIDMYCYRRRGHNEGDDPSFTQPLLYKVIQSRPSVRENYLQHLMKLGEVTQEEADGIAAIRHERLETAFNEVRVHDRQARPDTLGSIWRGLRGGRDDSVPDVPTTIARDRLLALLERLTTFPRDFRVHPRLERLLGTRRLMARGEQPLDWGTAELLALGSIAVDGHPIRLSGQDTQRGTFSQRHAILHDYDNDTRFSPLEHLEPGQAKVEIWNSPLSEIGVVGFEYGYSLDAPNSLVIWEAQFGDFANVAQVIIDQFITSAEDKWRRLSGLVLLLPHGFEGMGPEHSSARLERFLTLAAEDNIQVVQPSTPAQHFHCLRRQVLRPWRKPLIVLTPKSLLRLPEATSTLEECAEGHFRKILPDHRIGPSSTSRILLVSGKLYYELVRERAARNRDDVAIIRVEQLYPFPRAELGEALSRYPSDTPLRWVQDEPENMGAWRFVRIQFGERAFGRFPLEGIMRPESASPATGSLSSHRFEQKRLIDEALPDRD